MILTTLPPFLLLHTYTLAVAANRCFFLTHLKTMGKKWRRLHSA